MERRVLFSAILFVSLFLLPILFPQPFFSFPSLMSTEPFYCHYFVLSTPQYPLYQPCSLCLFKQSIFQSFYSYPHPLHPPSLHCISSHPKTPSSPLKIILSLPSHNLRSPLQVQDMERENIGYTSESCYKSYQWSWLF